ncbi:MAG: restriction endonuclease subunit S [Oscillospiraceae bacterium]
MSKLEELIEELCPDGVEYKTLGELGNFYGGLTGKSKDDFSNGNAKFITYKNIYSNPALKLDISDAVRIEDGEKQHTVNYGDILFTGSSETPDECGISSVLTVQTEEKLYLNSFCFIFRFNAKVVMLPDFSKHLFRSKELRHQIGKTANGVTRFNVSKKLMANVTIPLPPLPVQREIVRILDNFTELTAELTAELTDRKKQYEYYRDSLLTFGDEVDYKKLGDTCNMKSGKAIKSVMLSKEKDVEHLYPCFGGNDIRGYIAKSSHQGNYPIIGRQGALCGNINYATGTFYATEHAVVVESLGEYEQRYLFYLLTAMNLNQYKSQGAQPGLAVGNIENLIAPVPSLEQQRKAVDILDRFDTLCNDISNGLPAEIKARQQQYEYYRDKLLTFKNIAEQEA